MADGLSQSDLDALFAGISLQTGTYPVSSDQAANSLVGLEMPETDTGAQEEGRDKSGSDNLTQDEIDELLKKMLG